MAQILSVHLAVSIRFRTIQPQLNNPPLHRRRYEIADRRPVRTRSRMSVAEMSMPGIVTIRTRPARFPSGARSGSGRSPRLTPTIVASSAIRSGRCHWEKLSSESAPISRNSSRSGSSACRISSVSTVHDGPPRSSSHREARNAGWTEIATSTSPYRCSPGVCNVKVLNGDCPAGTNQTSSSPHCSRHCSARIRWPR